MTTEHRWYPVCRTQELVAGHVAQSQILGHELAVWRDHIGQVHVWENRCPHRGVRLSIGLNLGESLQCRYHGWKFATGTGQCIHIPAHPDQTPAENLQVTRFRGAEKYGLIWTFVPLKDSIPQMPELPLADGITLRSHILQAGLSEVLDALGKIAQPIDAWIWRDHDQHIPIHYLLQPMDQRFVAIHSLWGGYLTHKDWIEISRRENARLTLAFRSIDVRSGITP